MFASGGNKVLHTSWCWMLRAWHLECDSGEAVFSVMLELFIDKAVSRYCLNISGSLDGQTYTDTHFLNTLFNQFRLVALVPLIRQIFYDTERLELCTTL